MKIDVILASRQREQGMQAVLLSLNALSSGEHEIHYTVVCDEDDIATKSVAMTIRDMPVRVDCAPRSLLHERVNGLIAKSNADIFMPWCDDFYPLAASWDAIIANIVTKAKLPAFSWQEIQDPRNHTLIVLSREWINAAGRFYPEHFPFWFADTWLKEVFGFVYGQDMPIVEHLQFSHKREPTHNMHDLAFWFKVFAKTRPERIEEAMRVSAALGIPWTPRPDLIALFEKGDAIQLERVPQYEQVFGANKSSRSPMYLKAKFRAEKLFKNEEAFA